MTIFPFDERFGSDAHYVKNNWLASILTTNSATSIETRYECQCGYSAASVQIKLHLRKFVYNFLSIEKLIACLATDSAVR